MDLLRDSAGRKALFAALYLSEGAPIGFVWIALPTRLRAQGMAIDQVTALAALLVLPWALKFLWAPAVDALRTPRWSLRSWIVASQVAMGLALIPLLFLDPAAHASGIIVLLFAHAFAAATQDVAIDALAIATVPAHERGSLNGWMQAGMRAGIALFGGGALAAAAVVGDEGVIVGLVVLIWSALLVLVTARPVEEAPRSERSGTFRATLKAAALRRDTWLGLGVALLSGAAFEAVGAMAGPYLIDRGFSEGEAGPLLAAVPLVGITSGALAGGYLSDRMGRRRSTGVFLLLISVVVAGWAALDHAASPLPGAAIVALLSALYVSIGLFTSASYALFMDLTDRRLGGTQFSAYMGATNACEAGSGFLAGRLAAEAGYPAAFLKMALLSLLALPLLRLLRPR